MSEHGPGTQFETSGVHVPAVIHAESLSREKLSMEIGTSMAALAIALELLS